MPTQPYPLKYSPDKKLVFCELRGDYRVATPEEIVRQQYVYHLHGYYGYAYEQMDQERKTLHGHHSPRADIVIWQSVADKQANKTPVIVVECKSDNVIIIETDYWQGESYTRAVGCELFVTHNSKHTRFFKLVPKVPGEWEDIEDIPPLTYLFRYDGSIYGSVEWEDVQPLDEYLTTRAGADLELPQQFAVSYFSTDPFGIYADAESAFNDINTPLVWAGFSTISDFEDHITLLEGRFPAVAPVSPDEAIEVLIYEDLATKLGLQINELYMAYTQLRNSEGIVQDLQIPVRVSGIWKPTDPQESFWFFKPTSFAERMIVPDGTFAGRLSGQMKGEIYTGVWYLVMDALEIRHSDALSLIRRIVMVQQEISELLPDSKLSKSPMQALIEYQRSANLLTILLYAFSIPILGLLLAFIMLTAGLSVERRRNEVAVLRSRGAMSLQMVGIAAVESLLLGLVALAISIPTGMFVATIIGQTRSFLDFSANLETLRVNITLPTLQFGIAAVIIVIAAQVFPTFSSARHTVVSYKRERARMLRKPWWQQMWLDVFLLIPAAYGAYLLRGQGSVILLEDTFGTTPFQNPLLFLVPALGIFALTLFFLRLMPVVMSVIVWFAGRTKAVGLLMAARHLARTPSFYTTPLILLVLTLSLSAFTASLAYTLDEHLHDQLYYKTGADMQFQDKGEGTEAANPFLAFGNPDAAPAEEEEEPLGPRWFFLPVSEYVNASGVQAATRVGRFGAYTRISGGGQEGVYIGVDRAEFGQITFWRDDFASESLGALLNALATTRNGVLIPQDYMRQQALLIGDSIRVNVTTYGVRTDLDLKIVGHFDLFPSWYPSEGPLFVGNLDYLFESAGGQFPYIVWLKTDSDANYAGLGDETLTNRHIDWVAPQVEIQEEQQLPERQGLFGLLSVGFSAAAILTVLGFLLYALFSFQRRYIEFGVLRAVGLSSSQMTSFLAWELAFLILMGGALGTGLGAWMSAFFIPFLQIGVDEASRIPPYAVDIAWSAIFRIYALFGILFVVALVVLVVSLRRMKIFQAIKLGETA